MRCGDRVADHHNIGYWVCVQYIADDLDHASSKGAISLSICSKQSRVRGCHVRNELAWLLEEFPAY